MLTPRDPYPHDEFPRDPSLSLVLAVSVLLHGLVLAGAYCLPGLVDPGASRDLPFEVMVVQLAGGLESPSTPADPSLPGPSVVELPKTEPIVPRPMSLERIAAPVIPAQAIPIGERPRDRPIEPVARAAEPPPRVVPPGPVADRPRPGPQDANPAAGADDGAGISGKDEAVLADEAIGRAVGEIAGRLARGVPGDGVGPSSRGNFADQAKVPYYAQIREIVRSNWVPPAGAGAENLSVQFGIVIQPDGRVSARRLIVASGASGFDQSVEQAISRSIFPPLPPAFGGQEDRPILAFSYNDLSRR
ncbi:MAG: TonB C-terminal domain-containing protein [Deltaproteobacteria bacterium]|jgi:outer membrane biosynthesis protein TonB|nr:TonB C-terminal domain-containing protein [Deltaproteobacteria bacterium]